MEQAHTQLGDSFRVSALGAAGPSLRLGFALRAGLGGGQGPCPGALWASGSALPPLPSLKATSRLTGLLESWGLRVGRPQGRGQWRPGLPHPPSSLSETRREGGGLFTPPSLCVPTCLTGPTCPKLPPSPLARLTCAARAEGSCCRGRTSPSGPLRNSEGGALVSPLVSFQTLQKVETVPG